MPILLLLLLSGRLVSPTPSPSTKADAGAKITSSPATTFSPTSYSPSSVMQPPTTPAPSWSPTAQPPTEEPTTEASEAPTTSYPTPGPTTSNPTTPTTSSPTHSPTPPTTSAPTFAPTFSPSKPPTIVANPTISQSVPTSLPAGGQPTNAAVTQGVTRVTQTLGSFVDLGTVKVVIPANQAWGTGGKFSVSSQPFNMAQESLTPATGLTEVTTMEFTPDGNIQSVPIPFLENPIAFTIRLTNNLLSAPMDVCEGPVRQSIFPEALCSFFDHNSTQWNTSGCNRTNTTATAVSCSCNHLTEFAAILPNYNLVQFQNVLLVDQTSVERHPVGIVSLVVVYIIFALTLCYAARYDKKEQANTRLRQEKEAKWTGNLSRGVRVSFCKRYKSQLQTKHTWFSLFFRKKGTSYRSVDRTCVTLLSVLTIMALNAEFYGKNQTWIGYVSIVLLSSLVSFVPLITLEAIFTRIGPQGYKDLFERDHGVRPVPANRCCQCWAYYRLPTWFAYLMYLIIFAISIGLSVNIMLLAFEFDQNPEFVCNGRGSPSWIVSVLISIVINVFAVQPLKMFVVCGMLHLGANAADKQGMMELDDSQPAPLKLA